MTIKLGRIYLFLFTVCTLLWTQSANMIAQKISIENSLQQKVSTAVSSLLNDEKFLIIVSVEFSTVGGTLKKTAEPQLSSNSNNQATYIPGLPVAPSMNNKSSYSSSSKKSLVNDLQIGRVDVIVGMNEASIDGSIKQEIKSLIRTIIPQTKDCDDCIKIQAMQFQSNKKNDAIESLKNEVENLQSQIRQSKLEADATRLENLNQQLTEAKSKVEAAESIAQQRELQRLEEEKIRFNQLINDERLRKKQDSIRFANTEERLERVMESKIKSDSVIIREAIGIMKQQAGGGDESLLGMQVGSGSSNIMSYVLIIFLIISLMVVTFLAANNKKPNTIYLKPKNSGKENNKKDSKKTKDLKPDDKKDENPEKETPKKDATKQAPQPKSKPDEDAMRSELKSLRQTAVSLTVGEKEGASALIKEWLEDNPNKEESTDEGSEGE